QFQEIGDFIKKNNMRISMHPDQFTLINAKDPEIVRRSIEELNYHCEVLDLMGLDHTAKIQIHVGGVYGDKEASIKRFVGNYIKLPEKIKKRLVVENDDRSYSLKDCLKINKRCGVPILFDTFHHECLNDGENMREALLKAKSTWKEEDGELMIDYSTQKAEARRGTHTQHIDIGHFRDLLQKTRDINFDIMLEIKDKEESALKAIKEVGC
ncbi:MAG: UV DNA damage repair endonuclease UvsE, partial [Candidatus Dadabacteria bacterium]|nr:UV DNA damage repair endonuclease UvsE [Candidatus Dadabacteria bacterium]